MERVLNTRSDALGFAPSPPATAWRPLVAATGVVAIVLASIGINVLSLALPLAILQLYDRIIPAAAVETLVVLLLGVAVALVLEALLTGVRATLIAWSAARHEHALSRALFTRVMAVDPLVLRAEGPGATAERFTDASRIREFQAGQALSVLADLPFALLFLGLVAVIGGWIVLVPLGVVALATGLLALRDQARLGHLRAADGLRRRELSFLLETLGRIGVVKALGLEALMTRRFERLLRGLSQAEHDATQAGVSGQVLQAGLGGTTMVAVAAAGSLGVIGGTITLGELAACTLLANRALQPVQRVLGMWSSFRERRLQRRHVADGLALPGLRPPGAPALPALRGALLLDEVTVAGDTDGRPILDRMSLDIAPNECIGITGAAGCGKTTLLLVMAAMRRPDGGRLWIDGLDPWAHDITSLASQVVMVSARAPVFAGTLLDNLTVFAPTGSVAHIPQRTLALELADQLGIAAFAARLPKGFHTVIGPGSAYVLPPGIAQRLALARALAARPRVLLFDAANTALDSTADALLREVLVDHRSVCTQVIVSQRPSLLALADRVFLLADGGLRAIEAQQAAVMVPNGGLAS